MYLTGFADEASRDIDVQIRATKELGWSYIESRLIGDQNITDISDDEFDVVAGKLADADVQINCFGSAIANWGKKIDEPFDSSLEETRRAIPRMQKLGTKLVRIMSFAVLEDRGPNDQMRDERFARIRELTKMFLDAGIQPVHENCMNYGGMGWPYTLELIANVPGLKLVFDTGNPVFTKYRIGPEPYACEDAWEFYSHVKEHIAYVHIKDGYMDGDKSVFTHAGEGKGKVKEIMKDLLDSGYEGGISMEPHLAVVFHDDSVTAEDEVKYDNYVEYGKRFENLIREIGHGDKINSTKP